MIIVRKELISIHLSQCVRHFRTTVTLTALTAHPDLWTSDNGSVTIMICIGKRRGTRTNLPVDREWTIPLQTCLDDHPHQWLDSRGVLVEQHLGHAILPPQTEVVPALKRCWQQQLRYRKYVSHGQYFGWPYPPKGPLYQKKGPRQ